MAKNRSTKKTKGNHQQLQSNDVFSQQQQQDDPQIKIETLPLKDEEVRLEKDFHDKLTQFLHLFYF